MRKSMDNHKLKVVKKPDIATRQVASNIDELLKKWFKALDKNKDGNIIIRNIASNGCYYT